LRHAYDSTGVEVARQRCLAESHRYLEKFRNAEICGDVQMSVDAVCESPLYEAIVHKVLRSRVDLVMKSASGTPSQGRLTLEANDWQLMRTCPVTLMLTRGTHWREGPRFAAAVDVSRQETPELPRSIVETSAYLASGSRAQLDVLYSERVNTSADEQQAHSVALRHLAGEARTDGEHVYILSGDPEQTLPAFAARHEYDVFVLGALTHKKGIVTLVGTLTSKLVETLKCDFVLVKPDGYRCPIERSTDEQAEDRSDSRPHSSRQPLRGSPALWQTFFGD
jgi:universal stress protein E